MNVVEVLKWLAMYVCMHWFDVVYTSSYVVRLIKNNRPDHKG